jgi:hypothetical protein
MHSFSFFKNALVSQSELVEPPPLVAGLPPPFGLQKSVQLKFSPGLHSFSLLQSFMHVC